MRWLDKTAVVSLRMSNARLLISNLRYAYVSDSGKAVEALAKVDIALQPNDFVSLIGPSGCGKSTLFNVIAGLLIPDTGEVKLDGVDIIGQPGNVAYMMQRDLLLPWRTVLENVTLAPEIAGKSMVQARSEARSLLRRFGLEGFENAYPAALSGGMRQRAALLRTILCERTVILLDEPFGALDALTRSAMHEWLLGIQREFHRTMILITHDPDEAVYLSHRVYVATYRPMRIAGVVDIDLPPERHHDVTLTGSFAEQKRALLSLLQNAPLTA
ncbi:MAG TPA: ABC transporter ATP-binding protein [Stellaceae bacterium]|nr:ABC transporter ATP-binding protein [Stellaceae bacterium]